MALIVSPAFADSSLHIKLHGNLQNMYLYMETVGCVNIAAGVKGHAFPMEQGKVQSIVLVDRVTRRMYPQKMPASCQMAIDGKDKKVTVSGTIGRPVNDNIVIKNLQCRVS
jgi:hypothetical protein